MKISWDCAGLKKGKLPDHQYPIWHPLTHETDTEHFWMKLIKGLNITISKKSAFSPAVITLSAGRLTWQRLCTNYMQVCRQVCKWYKGV